jgi:hypothetical protein
MATVIDTPEGIQTYRALVIKKACELYGKHKIQVNRAYTPTAMLKAASNITGIVYKRGQHLQAAKDIGDLMLLGPQAYGSAHGTAR